MTKLFSPIKFRDLELKNRIFVSPMCQYSAVEGVPQAWHMVHLGARAVGGASLVIVEATGVSPEARITHGDVGLWNDKQAEAFKPIVAFGREQGAVMGVQLAHAGRKASARKPWDNGHALGADENAWQTLGPSAIPFSSHWPAPREMSTKDLAMVRDQFVASARRALDVGFEVIELHMAHGYLFHEFLSPLSNQRSDEYGGSLENRLRWPLEVTRVVREVWPARLPLFVRISASDWVEGGWDVEQSIVLARELKKLGVDLIDCSSGGNVSRAEIPVGPGYQVKFAADVRRGAEIATGAVGLITTAEQAEQILVTGQADAVLLARELLRDPNWPLRAAHELGVKVAWPKQYDRAQW